MGNTDDIDKVCVETEENDTTEIKMEMYDKRKGAADTSGQDYEVGICMLLFLRGLRHCDDFHLASNHGSAGDFDDAVFIYRENGHDHYSAILVQLKHKRSARISRKNLFADKHDFSIRKYFRAFESCHKFWRSFNVAGTVHPLKEVSYVLYSNAVADSELPDTEEVYPPFARLLCTCGKCVRFPYDSIENVFSDTDDTHNVDRAALFQRREFSKRFILCHSQGDQHDLDKCVGEEIRHLLVCADEDLFGVKEKLKSGFKSWWSENKKQTFYVTKEFPIWRKILRSRLKHFSEPYDSRDLRIEIRFSESCLHKLKSLIHRTKQLALLVEDQHETRFAYKKVKNAVESDYLAVSADTLVTNTEEILKLSHLRAFRTLVVIALNGLNNKYDDLLRGIAVQLAGGVVLICREATETWNTERINTIFSDLDNASADRFLEREINLQGNKIHLRDLATDVTELTSRLNASHLIELSCVDNNSISIGQVLDDPIPYFVPRRLTRRKLLKKSFFSGLKQNDEICIIAGDMEVLRLLRLRRGFSEESYGVMSPHADKSDCIVMLPEEVAHIVLHNLCGENVRARSVHLVQYKDGNFFWLKSHGDEMTVNEHITKEEMSCLSDTNDTEIIVCGLDGSGKSTWMEHVAVTNKNENATWILKVDVTEKSMAETNFDNIEHVKTFLLDRCSSSGRRPGNLEDILLSYALDVVGNVVIFVDKFDVLSTSHIERVFQLLSILPKVKHSKLVVATRPSLKDRVEKVLETFAYDLEDFDNKEKEEFLRNFWRFMGINYGLDEAEKVETIVENYGDCLSNPLMAYITAQTTFLNSVEPIDQLKLKPTPQLYSKLVQEELNNMWVQKIGVKDNSPNDGDLFEIYKNVLFEKLMKLAATIFLPEEKHKQRKINVSSEQFVNSRLGLIVCKDQKFHFLHRSFSEYFFALWLKSNDSDVDLLKEYLFKSNAEFVRQCFSSFYSEKHDLHAAVADDDVERVKSFMSQKKMTDSAGRTALHVAAMNPSRSSRAIAQLLIVAGVKEGHRDSLMNFNAMDYAVATSNWGVIDLLLSTRRFRNSMSARKLVDHLENKKEMFRKFCRQNYLSLVRFIVKLDYGLLTETYGYSKDTTLHLATESGSKNLVKWLLKRGFKVSVNNDGLTPASVAAREGHVNILRIFRKDKLCKDLNEKARPLHMAALKNQVDALIYLIRERVDVEAKDSTGETALHYAAREGHLEIVRHLVAVGNVNSVNGSHETPLHFAALRGRTAVVEALLDAGADENARNLSQNTPLHYAANHGETGVVDKLVSRGADITARDDKGRTPLHCAARYKHLDVVNTLIHAGASVNARDEHNATPLHHAAWDGNSNNDTYLLRKLWSGESVSPDDAYQTPYVVPPGTLEIVSALLKAAADVNAVDNQQLTPASYSRDEEVRLMLKGDDEKLSRFSLTHLPGSRSGIVM